MAHIPRLGIGADGRVVTGKDAVDDARQRPQGAALVVVCVASFMVALDLSIVNIALPSIQDDLGFAATDVQWVLTGYALPFGGFLLVGGRLADLLGRRRVFAGGLAVFALASLAGGLATLPWMLVAARVLQGLGAAAVSPAAFALLTTVFPAGVRRDRALSVYAATGALGFTSGLIASGLLTQLAGWRWVFLVNVPVAVATLLAALVVVPDPPSPTRPPRPNLVGAATITLGLAALLYALDQASHLGWGAPATQASLGVGAGLLAGFAATERRSAAPLIPPAFFRDPTLTVVNTVMLLKSTIGIAVLFVPTLYFQQVLDYSPLASALAFLPSGITAILAALTSPRLIHQLGGTWPVLVLGLSLQLTGLGLMTAMPTGGAWPVLLAGLLLTGLGFLWSEVALTVTTASRLTIHTRGLGAGVLRTAAQLGGALGIGIIAVIISARTSAAGGAAAGGSALVSGLQAGLWCGAGFTAAALVLVLTSPRSHPDHR